jgi:hypothetical protein
MRPKQVAAAGCPTVLIARDEKVALDLGMPALRLDAMDPKECLALIESRIGGRLDAGERAVALQLAEAVGRLPLALEVLSAARFSLDGSWSAVRDGILAEVAGLRVPAEDFAGGSADRPIWLQAIVSWVLKHLAADLRGSFAWLGVLRAGTRISPDLAGRLWRVDAGIAGIRLRRLAQVGLIDPVGPAGQPPMSYRIHEAIRHEAWNLATASGELTLPDGVSGLGLSPSGAHSELLARLRDGGPKATWPAVAAALDLIDDLPWHMEQAGRPEAVDALLGEETPEGDNAWFLARELRSDRRGYLRDVDHAWRRADAAVQAGGGAAPVAAQCRYALIRASTEPIWPDELGKLPALMVESGRWAPARAEAAIRQIRHCWTRMLAWTALASHLEGPARERAIRAARGEGMRHPEPASRARALLEARVPGPSVARVAADRESRRTRCRAQRGGRTGPRSHARTPLWFRSAEGIDQAGPRP